MSSPMVKLAAVSRRAFVPSVIRNTYLGPMPVEYRSLWRTYNRRWRERQGVRLKETYTYRVLRPSPLKRLLESQP